MDANTWNSYHIISNRARSICYATRQQQFRMKTEYTVNQLANQAENQMELMNNLQVRQPFIWSSHLKPCAHALSGVHRIHSCCQMEGAEQCAKRKLVFNQSE